MEVWKTIKDFKNYEVSNYGNIRSNHYSKVRILKQENAKGYLRVSLSKDNIVYRFQVHRLVAIHFILNIQEKPCVNHIDGNKLNNNVSNLEWCTYSENEKHSYKVLNKINPIRKLDLKKVNHIREKAFKGRNGNIKQLSLFYNVNVSTIYNILKNKYYV